LLYDAVLPQSKPMLPIGYPDEFHDLWLHNRPSDDR
jgi:hypothetical protein